MEMIDLESDVRVAHFVSVRLLSGVSGRWVKSPPASFLLLALFGDSRKMAAAPLYCVCRQPYDVSRFMIECDICKDWFHGRYVDWGVFNRCSCARARNTSVYEGEATALGAELWLTVSMLTLTTGVLNRLLTRLHERKWVLFSHDSFLN